MFLPKPLIYIFSLLAGTFVFNIRISKSCRCTDNIMSVVKISSHYLLLDLQTGSSRCFISISLFSHYSFLSWSSLIQLQVTYGWTKTFLPRDWSKQKLYKLYKCCVPPPSPPPPPPQKKKKKKKRKRKKRKIKKESGARLLDLLLFLLSKYLRINPFMPSGLS